MTYQIGDFACLPISGQVGKLISFGEWLDGSAFGHYDHAEIFVGDAPYGAPDVPAPYGWTMGAYPGGAKLTPLPSPADQGEYLWSHFGLSDAQRFAIVQAALECKDVPYSSLDYFALVAHRLHLPVPGLKRYIGDTGHLICSQLVDLCYAKAGYHLFSDGRWPGYVTPADLAALINA